MTQYASALQDNGEIEAAESRLQDAERLLAQAKNSRDGIIVIAEDQFQTLPARIAIIYAQNAQNLHNFPRAATYAQRALTLADEQDTLSRAQATVILGINYWNSGHLEKARQAMKSWIDSMLQVGNDVFAIASGFALADIITAQGQFHEAVNTYQQSLQLAAKQPDEAQTIIAHHHLGLAMLHFEMGEPEVSAIHLQKAERFGKQSLLTDWSHRWHLAQAKLSETQGAYEAALHHLDEASRHHVRVPVPNSRPIEALKARIYLKQGALSKAAAWVQEQALSVDDPLSYLHEFDHITYAKLLIAEFENGRSPHTLSQAKKLLTRLLKAAQDGNRLYSTVEIFLLQAMAQQAANDLPAARTSLEHAIALAEPQGIFQLFIDQGLPLAQLLEDTAVQASNPHFINKLLAAIQPNNPAKPHPSATPSPQPLSDPLSQRELDVLRLLKTNLSGPEIAQELTIALSTVRTHTKSIYSKLNANNRRQAIERAIELELM